MNPKFIQLQPWRDQLLGLTSEGEIYRINLDQREGIWTLYVDTVPLFPGFPHAWRRT